MRLLTIQLPQLRVRLEPISAGGIDSATQTWRQRGAYLAAAFGSAQAEDANGIQTVAQTAEMLFPNPILLACYHRPDRLDTLKTIIILASRELFMMRAILMKAPNL